jgi:predicted transcriptional regulator
MTSINKESESDDFEELDSILESKYINLGINEKTILYFLRGKDPNGNNRMRSVKKTYNNQEVEKVHFDVLIEDNIADAQSYIAAVNESKVRWFDVGKRSARLIYSELKEGNQLLEVKRTGMGKDTLYIPTAIQHKNIASATTTTNKQEL